MPPVGFPQSTKFSQFETWIGGWWLAGWQVGYNIIIFRYSLIQSKFISVGPDLDF
jgi:hypothetical protein